MHFTVIGGAGVEGASIVADLVKSGVSEVVIADIDIEKATRLAVDISTPSTSVSAVRVDASDHNALVDTFKDSDVVVSALGPFYEFGFKTVMAAIEAEVAYVDINDDYDATADVLELDEQAKAAGIPVIIGLGLTPGISNVCAKYAADKLDHTHAVEIAYVGAAGIGGAAVFLHFFHSLADEIPIYKDNRIIFVSPTKMPRKAIAFPRPFGVVEAPLIGHPEPITLPRHLTGLKSVKVRGAAYPLILQQTIEQLAELGLLSNIPVERSEGLVSPRRFILDCFDTHIETGEMATQIEAATAALPSPVYGALCVDVEGERAGNPTAYRYTIKTDLCDATDFARINRCPHAGWR